MTGLAQLIQSIQVEIGAGDQEALIDGASALVGRECRGIEIDVRLLNAYLSVVRCRDLTARSSSTDRLRLTLVCLQIRAQQSLF